MNVATDSFCVVIGESKEVMRLGQQQMTASAGFSVVGVAADARSLLDLVCEKRPDIVVLNDDLNGSELGSTVQEIRSVSPNSNIIVTLSTPSGFWKALGAKANAYCDREGSAEHFKASLNAVSHGECYLAPSLTQYLLHGEGLSLLRNVVPPASGSAGPSPLDTLSRREREVIGLLSEGHSNERIAQTLGLSIQTVKVHVKHILKKLKVTDRTQAVIKALKNS